MSAAAKGSSVVMYMIDVLPTPTYNTSLLGNAINTENTFPSVRSFRQPCHGGSGRGGGRCVSSGKNGRILGAMRSGSSNTDI